MSRDWVRLTWREKTWGERGWTIICWVVASVLCLAATFGGLLLAGRLIDGMDYYRIERSNCLKGATNGLEIERCKR